MVAEKNTDAMSPSRATRWRLRTRTLNFDVCPTLMGIVNVTPDSFSDGGHYLDHQRAVEHGLALAAAGAGILDVGGESTRPYAKPVDEAEELRRVVDVVRQLAEQTDVPISIDTSKARVAAEACAAGAEIINDVTGLEGDPKMLQVAVDSAAGVCAMHMQGTPQTMQDSPAYSDVVAEIGGYLAQRLQTLTVAGVEADRVCLDPGIGFGKTHQHNWTLLAEVGTYHSIGAPLLVGHSRKGFLAKVLPDGQQDRTAATVGVALALAQRGVQVIRVHDVQPVSQALTAFVAAGGVDGQAIQLQ